MPLQSDAFTPNRTIDVRGRKWKPRTQTDIELERRPDPDGCDADQVRRICERQSEKLCREAQYLVDCLAFDLADQPPYAGVPAVRKAMRAAMAALAQLKVLVEANADEEVRSRGKDREIVLTERMLAEEFHRLQQRNIILEGCLEDELKAKAAPVKKARRKAAKKLAKPRLPKPRRKPLFERMTASVNGNGFHAADGNV